MVGPSDEDSLIQSGSKSLPLRIFGGKKAGAALLNGPGGEKNSGYQFLTIVKPTTRPTSERKMSYAAALRLAVTGP